MSPRALVHHSLRELTVVNLREAMVDTIEARDGSAIRESVSPDYDRLRTFSSHMRIQ